MWANHVCYSRYKQIIQSLTLLSALLTLGGCATTSVLQPYPDQISGIKRELSSGKEAAARKDLAQQHQSADKMLYLEESGRVAQLAGDTDASMDAFNKAIEVYEENERKAKITATGAVSQVSAIATNDNAIPYSGSAYERIFVHNYQALNYLAKGDLEGAGVEVRRANLEQELALRKYEDELDKVKDGREAKQILRGNANYKQKFLSLSRLAGEVKNSFQNAYTFYVSGLIYEARGEYNDAYIDYKKALEIYPDNRYLKADVVRLAKRLGMNQDLELYKDGVDEQIAKPLAKDEGRVVVLYEQGYVPPKSEVFIPLWVIGVMHSIAFPTYEYKPTFTRRLSMKVDHQAQGNSDPIVDVSALAAKALEEQMPMIMVRQALRILARERTRENMNNSAVGLITGLAHLILNRADLRSWLTLPAGAQIMYSNVNAGQHTIELLADGRSQSQTVSVKAGQTVILHATKVDGRWYVKQIEL